MAALITTRGLGRRLTAATLNPTFGLGFGGPVGPIERDVADLVLELADSGVALRLFGPSLVEVVGAPLLAVSVSAPTLTAEVQAPTVAYMTCAPSIEACLRDPSGAVILTDDQLTVTV